MEFDNPLDYKTFSSCTNSSGSNYLWILPPKKDLRKKGKKMKPTSRRPHFPLYECVFGAW